MLVDLDDEEIGCIREAMGFVTLSASIRSRILDKMKRTEEAAACASCKNGYCRHSLQNKGNLHGDCRNHEMFEGV